MVRTKFSVFLLVTIVLIVGGTKFRHDYKYYPEAGGWLKLHLVPANWHEARLRCYLEGTVMASPLNHKLLDAMRVTLADSNVMYVFTGVHAIFSRGDFLSVEGVPLSRLAITWAPGQPDNFDNDERCLRLTANGTMADTKCKEILPYMCYKMKDKDMFLTECGTDDKEYTLDVRTGHCYKFHEEALLWSRAYMTCVGEGSYLAIINSDTEANVISDVCARHPMDNLLGNFRKDLVMLGFHDWGEPGTYLTVHGESIKKAGYAKWNKGFPERPTTCGVQSCGGAFRTGLLANLCCDRVYTFVCEKSPGSLLYEDDDQ